MSNARRHASAPAAAGNKIGGAAGLNAFFGAKAVQIGRQAYVAHSGRGWRGLLTRARRWLYSLVDGDHRLVPRENAGRTTYLKVPTLRARVTRALADFIALPAVLWRVTVPMNIVANGGLDYLLDAGLSGGTQITSWYLMLISSSPTVAAGDVMNSHAGWTEVTAYDEAARQAWSDGGVSSQSVNNSGSPAVFTISTNSTDVGGAALTSSSTKSGTTGTLYAAGAFTAGNKSLDDGDTLTVTATFTGAAA